MGRSIGDVDDNSCLMLPRCPDSSLDASEDVLRSVISTVGNQATEKGAHLVGGRGKFQELDVRRISVVLVSDYGGSKLSLAQERLAKIIDNAPDLLLCCLDVAPHRAGGVDEEQQVRGANGPK